MQKQERLIKYFLPEKYKIDLKVDQSMRNASGEIVITGFTKNKNTIKLHSKDLAIKFIKINGKDSEYEVANDTLVIRGTFKLEERVNISVGYNFNITDQMHGVYLSKYMLNGNEHKIVTTQFESHFAREGFPCIDEPEAKAVFDLSISAEDHYKVLSNMPEKETHTEGKIKTVIFESTPKMSTYLLAFVIGEFKHVSSRTKRGISVNTYASLAQNRESLEFASDAAVKTIDFYEEYFGVNYPLPKCDQVALPDFEAGAMENWGLVTYRETCMIVDPKNSSIDTRRYVLSVITHELSHQWFGNLVTMKWWDDLWLNESFASVMEYVAADVIYPEYEIWQNFFTNDVVAALKRDCLSGVQPVKQDVSHPDEISTLFDGAIVYAKGARLIYMLMNLIGEYEFKKGLKDYFKAFAYGNTIGDDLWSSLSKYSSFDVKEFMDSWIEKPGYPVVFAKKSGRKISLEQKRFLLDSDSDDSLWPIPLDSSIAELPKILRSSDYSTNLNDDDSDIRINKSSASHFITRYDDELLENWLSTLDDKTDIQKADLLLGYTLLSKTDNLSTSKLLNMLDRFKYEKSSIVWDNILFALRESRIFVDSDSMDEANLKNFTLSIMSNGLNRLGFDSQPKDNNETLLKKTFLSLAVYAEDKSTVSSMIDCFINTNLESIDGELRSLIISAKIKFNETDDDIDKLLFTYKLSNNAELRDDICAGLTSTKKANTINKLLSVLKDKSVIRLQDFVFWVVYLVRNSKSKQATWDFIRDNWSWIESEMGGDKSYGSIPRYIAGGFKTKKDLEEFKDFFLPMSDRPELKRSVLVGIEEIKSRVTLIKDDEAGVKEFLKKYER